LEIQQLLDQFPLLEETPAVFRRWLDLVAQYSITGKRVYDSRLLAVAQTHGMTHILTFNSSDFPAASNVAYADPHDVSLK
jgi:predicted nucleic acid-binding protein